MLFAVAAQKSNAASANGSLSDSAGKATLQNGEIRTPLQLAQKSFKSRKGRIKEDDPKPGEKPAVPTQPAPANSQSKKAEAASQKPEPPAELLPKTVATPQESLQIFSSRVMERISIRLAGGGSFANSAPANKKAAKPEQQQQQPNQKKGSGDDQRKAAAAGKKAPGKQQPASNEPTIKIDLSKIKGGFSKGDRGRK